MVTPAYPLTAPTLPAPRLSLDFTSALLDARVSLTRADNTATRINSSGYVEVVSANTPRFDYDGVSLACKGLLIEQAKQNIITDSNNFNVGWTKANSTVTVDTITSPDNTLNADLFISSSGFPVALYRSRSVTTSEVYTLSVFAKAIASPRLFELVLASNTNLTLDRNRIYCNPSTGAIPAITNQITSGSIQLPNGWWRFYITFTPVFTGTAYYGITAADNLAAGDVVYLYGAQLEEGYLTSYVPTGATAVTRNADVAVMTGTNFSDWYNASKGTFRTDASSTANSTRPIISADNNTANESLVVLTDATTPKFIVKQSGAEVANVSAGTITANTSMFAYTSYDANFFGIARPTARQVDTSGTVPTVDRLRIGADQAGNYLNGHVQKIQFWP